MAAPFNIFDPQAQKWAMIAQALASAGQGMMGAPTLGQGLAAGLQGAATGLATGRSNYRTGALQDYQIQQAEAEAERKRKQDALWASLFPTWGAPSSDLAGGRPAIPFNQSMPPRLGPQFASAGGAASGAPQTAANPLLAGLDPSRMSALAMLGPERGLPLLAEQAFAKPQAPISLPEGGTLIDPTTFEILAQGGEKPPFPGAVKNDGGNWVVDPDFQQAMLERAQAGRASTTVNMGPTGIDYGNPEAGLAWARNPDGTVKLDARGAPIAVPYQGGSVYREEAAVASAAAAKGGQQEITASIVTQDIDRALKLIEQAPEFTTALGGDLLSKIPGTVARDVKGLLDTVKANAGFDRLQQMRDSSKTGGALGNVTVPELQMLQAAIGNLEQSQRKQQLTYNMKRVANIYSQIIDGPGHEPYDLTRAGNDRLTPQNPYIEKYGLTPRTQ